jgi:DNA-binding transcriptional regulator YhcF (GntR family)
MSETVGYTEIAAYLRQQIQDGTLRPGDTMPSFKQIGKQFGVAQTTVNRAFKVLKLQGLTVAKPGVGTVVADLGRNTSADTPSGSLTTHAEALQMSRDLTAFIEQQTTNQERQHGELLDCMPMVAYCAWAAAWRQARNDQALDEEIAGQVQDLIYHSDFLDRALHRHNWRNVNRVLAAFRDAGLAGSADVPAFYTHTNHIPEAEDGVRGR